ncbi:MAG: dTMP kinase [Thermoplasmata archaeon]|nr:MAG: dTMP kinase [Thermoplasmata archaeon]
MNLYMFIVFEGIDGAGKGTQAKMLAFWLRKRGYEVFLTKEPTNGEVGKLIKKILKKDEINPRSIALLFAADRAEHVDRIKKELDMGKIVLSERYLLSSLAYQGASGLELEWIYEINKFAIKPDLTIYLDIPPEVGLKRIKSRDLREFFERVEFLVKVREIYHTLINKEENIIVIDATKDIGDIQREIRRRLLL